MSVSLMEVTSVSGLGAGYDAWRTMSDTDEAEERERKRLRDEALADRADYMRDREKDERAEREHDRRALKELDDE